MYYLTKEGGREWQRVGGSEERMEKGYRSRGKDDGGRALESEKKDEGRVKKAQEVKDKG